MGVVSDQDRTELEKEKEKQNQISKVLQRDQGASYGY